MSTGTVIQEAKLKVKQGAYSIQEFKETWDFDQPQDAFASNLSGQLNRAFLSKMKIGFTANVCCGTDRTGDVRVDIDRSFDPDVIGDLHSLPFPNDAFDTVICDPPFSMFNKFAWKDELARIAKKRVILSAPNINVRMKSCWVRQVWFTDGGTPYLRLWHVFTRQDENIANYGSMVDGNHEQ